MGIFDSFRRKQKKEEISQEEPIKQVFDARPASVPQKVSQPTHPELTSIPGYSMAYRYQNTGTAMVPDNVKDFSAISPGDSVTFVPEPSNSYDTGAIKVISNGKMLGYVYKGQIKDMIHDFTKRGEPILAFVQTVIPNDKAIKIDIGFYKKSVDSSDSDDADRGELLGSGRLTANSGEDAQNSIQVCSEGDEVTVEYDVDKDRYEVSYIDFIGCLPKKLEEFGNTATFYVDEIGETDNGKSYIVVSAYNN